MQSKAKTVAAYLTGVYASATSRATFEAAYRAAGRRFDMGQSCVRFRTLDDLPLPLIGETIASLPVNDLVALMRRSASTRTTRTTTTASKPRPRRAAKKR